MRREVEAALTEKRNIVPLTLDGFSFSMPKIASQLTGVLGALKHYNALNIPPDYFMEAMERLRNRFLNVPLASVVHPASLSAQRAATEQQMAAAAAPASRDSELTAQQLVERGLAALNVDEQLSFYTEAIRINPDYAESFVYRGDARLRANDVEGALGDYSTALRLNPHDAVAFYNRGNARELSGDLRGALDDFSEAIRISPDNADAFSNRGNVYRQTGDLQAAFQDYSEAIRLSPGDASALTDRGTVRRAMGDSEGALQDYAKALRLMSGVLGRKSE
jgi:tetratricopeptide (TPR) repeat protein